MTSLMIDEAAVQLVHRLPGRVRFWIAGLKGNQPLADEISGSLSQLKGVYSVQASPLTGRVLVIFDEESIKLRQILPAMKKYFPVNCEVNKPLPGKRPVEPEDLPIKKQLFNVALGGGVLAYMGLKHFLVGRTPLAKDPHIFNLAAATTIISGYPVLRSGFQGLMRGRINYDLTMSALAIGTTLARESIPGLTVMWLTNLASLAQSLVLKRYLQALPAIPGDIGQAREEKTASEWNDAAQVYGRKVILPIMGLAALTGFTGGPGGFGRALAMLLAANPSPAGLAAPTAAAAAMAGAGKKGILFRNAQSLGKLARADTVIFDGTGSLPEAVYDVGDILPMPGISKPKLLGMAAAAAQRSGNHFGPTLKKALAVRGYSLQAPDLKGLQEASILMGDEGVISAAGIDTKWGIFKAKRLKHLQQFPIYVTMNGQLAGLIGIRQGNAGDLRHLVNGLLGLGIQRIGLMAEGPSSAVEQTARDLGIHHTWSGLTTDEKVRLLRQLKGRGQNVAVIVKEAGEISVLQEADVTICTTEGLRDYPVDVVISHASLLPDAFRMSRRGKQRAKQNLALVQGGNALGLALASTGRLSPMAAKVYGDLVSLAVCSNAFRLLSYKAPAMKQPPRILPTVKQEIAAALEEAVNPAGTCQWNGNHPFKCSSWHSMTAAEVLRRLSTDLDRGLAAEEVLRRMNFFGPNKMAEEKPRPFLARIFEQLKDFLVKTLMASAVVCAILGEFGDALAITAILALNALLGAMQEQKAEGAIQALGKMTAPTARVRRAGKVERIPAADLVPGDVVLLEQGDGIPADLRLLETHGLEIEESALTGEPYPVAKHASQISDCVPLLDCENLAFMGTNVTRGRAVGVVTGTGMFTEIGNIAGLLNKQQKGPTPLQNRMAEVSGVILKYCLAVSGLVVLAGVIRGGSLFKMFLTGVSLAVAAIPEGLPAVVTIALASGVRRMAKENAVVRHLPAVETLGSATLICTDKTGTLTQNRQQVQAVYTGGGWWQADSAGAPLAAQFEGGQPDELVSLLTAGILCNNANLQWSRQKSVRGKPTWQVEGDPTEGALLLAGLREDMNYKEIRERWQRVKEIPFDAERLRMTVICQEADQGYIAFVKGAPEVVINLCSQMKQGEQVITLDEPLRSNMFAANEKLTAEAMRVLAIAYRPTDDPEMPDTERSFILLGLVGMVDPPRPEVPQAIATCHRAGIKVVMITGDHPHTALAVARKVGICSNNLVLTGRDIDLLNDLELAAAVRDARVFARVLPAQKLRLIQAFHSRGEILAMVGDGINDAPAVKEADIGVAMGLSGTDVTKQAADMILTDDNFATLVSAVEQGRGIYNNIRKSVRYLLATNVGLVLLVFMAVLLGLPMPLLPIQLLFLNVLGDGLPALALGVAPPNRNIMKQPPRPANQSLFADGLSTQIVSRGFATGLVGLETYRRVLQQGDQGLARTVAMSSFIASKLLFALECSEKKESGPNRYLTGSVALSALLLGGAVYLPQGRQIFKTSPLALKDVSTVLGASGLTYVVEKFLTAFIQSQQTKKTEKKAGSIPQ